MKKIALVHDYLVDYGGAERVVEALHELFPDAPLYVAFVNRKTLGLHWQNFANWKVHESWIRWIPFYQKFFSPLRIFAPSFFASFDLDEFDIVISSSNAYFSKAVKVRAATSEKPAALHICYCHTPARSLYGYSTMTNWQQNPFTHFFGTLINHYLRVVDVKLAQKVDFFIANSEETQRRIQKFYRRDATVIYPPVNVPKSLPVLPKVGADVAGARAKSEKYFLYVNRLAFAKHPEIAVAACTELRLPLKVVGSGKMEKHLREIAGPTVEFLGAIADEKLDEMYAGARALLYPVVDEDFGIVPVESMGHGVPVIAHRSGGPKETVVEGKTGVFFEDLSVEGLKAAIKNFAKIEKAKKFDRVAIHRYAQKFSKERFLEEMKEFVEEKTKM